ncbi:hypothetical protein L484_016486 [Morus notabilis]|uniref:Uncharacterized protein n=1 Tax=Morus notabilis TaxID=981085 RepID=W9QGJ1_9ROSA|nr:hypothetical protein L484_016486 [Morus notabilis]
MEPPNNNNNNFTSTSNPADTNPMNSFLEGMQKTQEGILQAVNSIMQSLPSTEPLPGSSLHDEEHIPSDSQDVLRSEKEDAPGTRQLREVEILNGNARALNGYITKEASQHLFL